MFCQLFIESFFPGDYPIIETTLDGQIKQCGHLVTIGYKE